MAGSNPYIHPEENRAFTLRESARIQTFSDAHFLGEVNIQTHSRLLKRRVLIDSWECGAGLVGTESF